jgi:glyoxylase-like metal-dependent hydrolase (beta-lactamase superfamily II)
MKRREFLWKSAALAGLAAEPEGVLPSLRGSQAPSQPNQPRWQLLSEHVGLYRDVVNVGVIRKNGKALLIDSGEGSVLNEGRKLRLGSIEGVLYTHYHRDQCSGAPALKKAGVKINVPASEARFFRNATEFWLEANSILNHRYNFRPEIMVLRESVAPDHELRPEDAFQWEGIPIRVVATPGHTDGSLSYLVETDGKTFAFTGDLIYGPGQIWEFYSLQKAFPGMTGDYWGFGGAVADVVRSLDLILDQKPTVLIPSHGVVMKNPDEAIALLKRNLRSVMENFFTLAAWRIYFTGHFDHVNVKSSLGAGYDVPMLPPLPAVNAPPWIHRIIETSSYIQAADGSIFLFDCGFEPIVPAIDHLVRSGAIKGVDAIWISHYHDDHLNSVNEVRRKYGAKVYVQKEMQDILENPIAYCMPCLCPESIHVDHALSEGEVIDWKGYKLTAYYFPGQTLFHDGLLIERDGARIFMTGDSFANWGIDDYCSYNRNFIGEDGRKAGYERCLRLLLELKPDMLMAAHWGPEPVSRNYLEKTLDLLEERWKLFKALFPWDDPNFGLDPHWVRAYPYRQSILPGQSVTLEARIFNHSDLPRMATVELRAPKGWRVQKSGAVTIPAHTEGAIRIVAQAPVQPPMRRQVLGLAVQFGGIDLGEITEAIVDYLQ